ncbi:MAG: polysaccharide deacetylase family protein [Ignavibacteriaceae bacterium]
MKKYIYNPPSLIKKFFKDFIWETKIDKILLTFDDGPVTKTTETILNFLNDKKIKAAFFCVGENCKKNPKLLAEIIKEKHLVANHTFHHKRFTKIYEAERELEIDLFNNLLLEEHNYKVKYFRPPYGRFNLSTQNLLKKKNLKNVMWSLLTYDYKNDLKLVKFAVKNYLKKNSIIVLHDSLKSKNIIIDSLEFILDEADKKGFQIGKPNECLK